MSYDPNGQGHGPGHFSFVQWIGMIVGLGFPVAVVLAAVVAAVIRYPIPADIRSVVSSLTLVCGIVLIGAAWWLANRYWIKGGK